MFPNHFRNDTTSFEPGHKNSTCTKESLVECSLWLVKHNILLCHHHCSQHFTFFLLSDFRCKSEVKLNGFLYNNSATLSNVFIKKSMEGHSYRRVSGYHSYKVPIHNLWCQYLTLFTFFSHWELPNIL